MTSLSSAASLLKRKTGSGMVKWRLHAYFEVDRSAPIRIDVTRQAGLWTGRKPTLRSALQVLGVAVTDRLKPVLFSGQQSLCWCFRGGGTRAATRSKNSKGDHVTTPLTPGRDVEGRKLFSLQITTRGRSLEESLPAAWAPIMIETL